MFIVVLVSRLMAVPDVTFLQVLLPSRTSVISGKNLCDALCDSTEVLYEFVLYFHFISSLSLLCSINMLDF
ncbi:hypothetical protein L2E82_06853 [Cichorium intybus]|uniref:Uncharacterized protein n=1 Tax=Cichorium intybus TaxID=13427 RepID=A0ACB9G2U2_CICIN|nr:hypothetical protein L2E82_06853 [Cichorium intybus]